MWNLQARLLINSPQSTALRENFTYLKNLGKKGEFPGHNSQLMEFSKALIGDCDGFWRLEA